MAARVLDSWALMAFFEDEPAAAEVERYLDEAESTGNELLLTAINWGEVYYSVMRAASQAEAERIAAEMGTMPVQIVPAGEDLRLTRQAAVYKATRRMSYADCFAAAAARLHGLELLTGDPEFRQVAGEIAIHWLPTR